MVKLSWTISKSTRTLHLLFTHFFAHTKRRHFPSFLDLFSANSLIGITFFPSAWQDVYTGHCHRNRSQLPISMGLLLPGGGGSIFVFLSLCSEEKTNVQTSRSEVKFLGKEENFFCSHACSHFPRRKGANRKVPQLLPGFDIPECWTFVSSFLNGVLSVKDRLKCYCSNHCVFIMHWNAVYLKLCHELTG